MTASSDTDGWRAGSRALLPCSLLFSSLLRYPNLLGSSHRMQVTLSWPKGFFLVLPLFIASYPTAPKSVFWAGLRGFRSYSVAKKVTRSMQLHTGDLRDERWIVVKQHGRRCGVLGGVLERISPVSGSHLT